MIVSKADLNKDYIKRINSALLFIDHNLDAKLSLASVAEIAHYSPYHFHRLFKAIIGETLNAYIVRKRIEKTAIVLITQKHISIAQLYLQYGFTSNSTFTRAFKSFYGVNPTEFRGLSENNFSKISQTESKIGQEHSVFEKYICNINNHLKWIKMNATIKIKEIPQLTFASITHIGIENLEATFNTLIRWAAPKGLMTAPEAKLGRVFHDSFKVTAPDKVRMSIGLLTQEGFNAEGEITKTITNKGKYIVGRFEITTLDFETSWSALFVWMNDKGYKKAEGNPFEIYHNDFREHPEQKFIVDFYIPIV